MAATSVKAIIPGVMLRKGAKETTLRFIAMIKGQRFQEKFDIPCAPGVDKNKAVALYVDPKTGKATRLLKDEYRKWYLKKSESVDPIGTLGPHEPTLKELLSEYEKIALERMRNPRFGRPSQRTIDTALKNVRYLMEAAGVSENETMGKLFNTETLGRVFEELSGRISQISAWSYVVSVNSVTAKWTLLHYQKIGWKIAKPLMPDVGNAKNPPRYKRPSIEMMRKQDEWYASLVDQPDKMMYLAVTLVYQLAMRPVDVLLVTGKNFRKDPEDGMMHLVYTPEKTKHSSGREVNYPIAHAAWQVIERLAGDKLKTDEPIVEGGKWLFHKINTTMRYACGMQDERDAVYELRKRCIDTVRRKKGVDHAVAISGDRRETIDYYYSEPTRVIDAKPLLVAPIKG